MLLHGAGEIEEAMLGPLVLDRGVLDQPVHVLPQHNGPTPHLGETVKPRQRAWSGVLEQPPLFRSVDVVEVPAADARRLARALRTYGQSPALREGGRLEAKPKAP